MQHISEFIIPKIRQIERVRQLRLFPIRAEKGSREWHAFSSVHDDIVDVYHVRAPRKAIVIAQQNHVLRITYPPVRQLRRA